LVRLDGHLLQPRQRVLCNHELTKAAAKAAGCLLKPDVRLATASAVLSEASTAERYPIGALGSS